MTHANRHLGVPKITESWRDPRRADAERVGMVDAEEHLARAERCYRWMAWTLGPIAVLGILWALVTVFFSL